LLSTHLNKQSIRIAEEALCNADKVLRDLILRIGSCTLAEQPSAPFETLVRSIVGQQLSGKAAATIYARLTKITGTILSPCQLMGISDEELRATGMSSRKMACIRSLSRLTATGQLDFSHLESMSDEQIIALLTRINGIGRWTAEMFLIFGLKRPDVLSLSDAGLKRSVKLLYGEGATLLEAAENWGAWRSVASWYLWRNLD
jgi:DNA-3-methyladenine glycosylase II